MFEKRIRVAVEGIRPLLMHEFRFDDSTKKKSVYDPKEDAEKALIKDPSGNIAVKAAQFESCICNAGKEFKFRGKKTYNAILKAGIRIEPEYPLLHDQNYTVDVRPVVIQRARIARARPRFEKWNADFEMVITDDQIDPLILKEIMEHGGLRNGIGDYRPKYGLFKVTSWDDV